MGGGGSRVRSKKRRGEKRVELASAQLFSSGRGKGNGNPAFCGQMATSATPVMQAYC